MVVLISKKKKKEKADKKKRYAYVGMESKTKDLLKCRKNDLMSEICRVNA